MGRSNIVRRVRSKPSASDQQVAACSPAGGQRRWLLQHRRRVVTRRHPIRMRRQRAGMGQDGHRSRRGAEVLRSSLAMTRTLNCIFSIFWRMS